jgi:hypothetical protein
MWFAYIFKVLNLNNNPVDFLCSLINVVNLTQLIEYCVVGMARLPTSRNLTRHPLEGGSPDPAKVPEGDEPLNRDQSRYEVIQ